MFNLIELSVVDAEPRRGEMAEGLVRIVRLISSVAEVL
jgi:hypothetical protein